MENTNYSNRVFVNYEIRAREVRCIDQFEKNHGVIKTFDAIKLAEGAGLDLVMVTPANKNQPAICKILDSGKYKYEMNKRQKDLAKKQRESIIKIKEIKFRPTTDFNDLKTKAKHAEKFLSEGCKIKVVITFKGRELAHKEVAMETLEEFIELVPNAQITEELSLTGKQMTCMLGFFDCNKEAKAS